MNKALPEHRKLSGLEVKTSNLCSEITLPTGLDRFGEDRTAVCCLSSLNLEKYPEWENDEGFIEDIMRFLDNVLQDFIDNAPDDFSRAKYSAMRERSVGLGVMGFHSFLQANRILPEGAMAKVWNMRMFKHIRAGADAASRVLAEERGACPDAEDFGIMERFSNKLSVAPTASISIICGGASPGIEPAAANSFTHKLCRARSTSAIPISERFWLKRVRDMDEVWSSITTNEGSVQHLDFPTEDEKAVFRTAFEIDQRWIVEMRATGPSTYVNRSRSTCSYRRTSINATSINCTFWPGKGREEPLLLSFQINSACGSRRTTRTVNGRTKSGKVNGGDQPAERIDYEECLPANSLNILSPVVIGTPGPD